MIEYHRAQTFLLTVSLLILTCYTTLIKKGMYEHQILGQIQRRRFDVIAKFELKLIDAHFF